MNRVRISTTVDGTRLERCRRLVGRRDSEILDRALAALIEQEEARRELDALDRWPYEDDSDLTWTVPSGPDLPYDGDVPADVLAEVARRRSEER
jgi:hypothetical protein